MKREEAITTLISNESGWRENDREFLVGLSDEHFALIANAPKMTDDDDKAPVKTPKTPGGKKGNGMKKGQKAPPPPDPDASTEADEEDDDDDTTTNDELTADEYIANAPAEIRESLEEQREALKANKESHIKMILANSANILSREELLQKNLRELKALSALAGAPSGKRQASYAGAQGAAAPTGNENSGPPPLALPTMNFNPDPVKTEAAKK